MWASVVHDTKYAVRLLIRNRGFSIVAILALTLGIGANTAIFTIVNGVLINPLPYAAADELVMVWSTNSLERREHDTVAPRDFIDLRTASSFSSLHATYGFLVPASLTSAHAGAEQIIVSVVTPGTFEMLGRAPLLGRTFTEAELDTGVVISHAFWQTRLGGDPSVLGRTLTIQYQPRTVLGVMPPDFVFPYRTMLGPSGFTRAHHVDAWMPLSFVEQETRATGLATLSRSVRFLAAVGRLKPGVSVDQAAAEVAGIARHLADSYPDTNRNVGATVVPLHDQAVGSVRSALLLLLGGVGFVLLMACVNLANLLLARSAARSRELAIRTALGAGRGRLVRQTLVETALLSTAGGVLALVFLDWCVRALVAIAPAELPRIDEVRTEWSVVAFTFAVSILTGVLVGTIPAYAASRPQLQLALRESARGATAGRSHRRVRNALIVAQVALALVLTAGAALLLRSFVSLLSVDPGFRADNLLTLQITVPPRHQTAEARRAFYADLISRLEALPGVVAVGGTTRLPLGSTNVSTKIVVEGRNLPPSEWPEAEFRRAIHHYFEAMEIPVMRGRLFTAADGPEAPPVAVVNATMAREMFSGEEPVGRRVRFGSDSGPWTTIVGVIGDVRHSALEAPPAPEIYINYRQNPPVNPFLVLGTEVDPASLVSAVRAELHGLDKDIAAYDIRPMSQVRAESVSQRRFILSLAAAFGLLALVMAAVGVYGVMELVVSERTAEIGIRLALGAQRSQVLWTVLGQGLLLAAGGVGLGLCAYAALAPLLSAQVYGVTVLDPPTVAGVSILLLAVALAACYVPARGAMRIDPVDALRAE
jgi:predicted permease